DYKRHILPQSFHLFPYTMLFRSGKYYRNNPFVFSFVGRCQGEWGSAKNTLVPVSRVNYACPESSFRDPRSGSGATGEAEQTATRSEEHTSELQSRFYLVCSLLLE